jgi:hypothetical protein
MEQDVNLAGAKEEIISVDRNVMISGAIFKQSKIYNMHTGMIAM